MAKQLLQKRKNKREKEKSLKIKFNKDLYKLNSIKSAIKEYHHLADFDLKKTGKYIQVELKNIDQEVKEIIKDEFCNYVFFLMKK